MYQVQVTLSCSDYNTVTIRNLALLPRVGDELKCKVCGEHAKVLYVGQPYPVKIKGDSE